MQRPVGIDADELQVDARNGTGRPAPDVAALREHLLHGLGVGIVTEREIQKPWAGDLYLFYEPGERRIGGKARAKLLSQFARRLLERSRHLHADGRGVVAVDFVGRPFQ